MDVLVVMAVLALACLSAVSVYLIPILIRLKHFLTEMESDMRDVVSRVLPVLENMEFITARGKSITENIDDRAMAMGESIGSACDIVDSLAAMERKIQDRLEGPTLDSVMFTAVLLKGVRTFLERVRASSACSAMTGQRGSIPLP